MAYKRGFDTSEGISIADIENEEYRLDMPVLGEWKAPVKQISYIDEDRAAKLRQTASTTDYKYSTGLYSTLEFRYTARLIKNMASLHDRSRSRINRSRTIDPANKSDMNTTNASMHMNSQTDEIHGAGFVNLLKFKENNKDTIYAVEPDMEKVLSTLQKGPEIIDKQKKSAQVKNFIRLNKTTTRIRRPVNL